MRLVVKQYNNDANYIVETDNDATKVIQEEGTKQKAGTRISAIVEVSADDNKVGMDRVLTAIRAIEAHVQKKKQDFENAAS